MGKWTERAVEIAYRAILITLLIAGANVIISDIHRNREETIKNREETLKNREETNANEELLRETLRRLDAVEKRLAK